MFINNIIAWEGGVGAGQKTLIVIVIKSWPNDYFQILMIFSRWLASLLRRGGMGRARGEEVRLFFLFFVSFLMLSFLSLLSIAFLFRCMAKVSKSFQHLNDNHGFKF